MRLILPKAPTNVDRFQGFKIGLTSCYGSNSKVFQLKVRILLELEDVDIILTKFSR
jgi:hypothetical protein